MNKFSKISACRNLVGKFLKVSSSNTLLSDFYRKGVSPAFTLAEMMVVLLIMSIILAAMAPVMTTRDNSMRDNSSPWKWTDDRADTYFGLGDTQTAMIGQKEKKEIDGNYARLIINAVTGHDDEAAHILFKKGEDAITGRLYLSGGNTFLSNGSLKGSVNTAIGYNTLLDNESGQANTAIGAEAMKQNKGNNNTAVGANAYHLGTGENNTVVGVDAFAENSGSNNTAIGVHALRYNNSNNNVAIGYGANSLPTQPGLEIDPEQATNTIAIGPSTQAFGNYSIAMGTEAAARSSYGIAIGYKAKNTIETTIGTESFDPDPSVAIGVEASTGGPNAIAIGSSSKALLDSVTLGNTSTGSARSVVIGKHSSAYINAISIGEEAISEQENAIAIGTNAKAGGTGDSFSLGAVLPQPDRLLENSIAIGYNANAIAQDSLSLGTNSSVSTESDNAIAIGYNASVISPDSIYSDDLEYSKDSVAIGTGATVSKSKNSIVIGNGAKAENGSTSFVGHSIVAIGHNSYSDAASSVAIGDSSTARSNSGSVAIGNKAYTYGGNAIAIGDSAIVANLKDNGVRLGNNFDALYNINDRADYAIAIGKDALATTDNSIAIGNNACKLGGGKGLTNKFVCIGSNSGPQNGTQQEVYNRNGYEEHVFIGGKSKFNDGAAVLEVHNSLETTNLSFERSLGNGTYSNTAVVINGNLVVKGKILMTGNNHDIGTNPFLLYVARDGSEGQYAVRGGALLLGGNTEHYYYLNGLGPHNATSDRRLKYVGKENTSGLDKIRQLKVFNYTFKKDEKKTPHVGVIAQDLQKIFPDAVSKAKDGFLKIRFEDMFYAMINAIKELDAKYKAQEQRINELEKRIEQLEAKIK